ncbi:MAG: ABC transporter ATP-binding protein [Eubacteriales bacterium]|nr:ABC transporter ATP-binding protein [Clostridiales bacterium]MDY3071770.1 ABC transporter ATP-binding protein [Eubacteriales bacterium]
MGIAIENVTKRFGKTCALDGVSCAFGENRIYGLLGNNGAGKTTLLNLIANRLYADEGTITVDGEDVRDRNSALEKIFYIGEQNLYPEEMRVEKALRTTAAFYPAFDLEYAHTLAERFKLNTKKKITSLSTGYASIFRLITALSTGAAYLLLDEPVLGLDATNRDLFYRTLLERYTEKPATIVLSTHLIGEVAALLSDVVIIHNGRILRCAEVETLLESGYSVTGPAGQVDAYASGRKVLSSSTVGGIRTVCIEGKMENSLPEGLEAGKLNLQDYFISLMKKSEE